MPPVIDLDSVKILKKVNTANKALAELKGITKTIPNSGILINTLVLQEAKDSSAIENIITTHDELFKADLNIEKINFATKEVQDYSYALKKGFELVETNQILVTRYIVEIQEILETGIFTGEKLNKNLKHAFFSEKTSENIGIIHFSARKH